MMSVDESGAFPKMAVERVTSATPKTSGFARLTVWNISTCPWPRVQRRRLHTLRCMRSQDHDMVDTTVEWPRLLATL